MMESLPFSVLVAVLLFIAWPLGGDPAWATHLAATLVTAALALELALRARRPNSTTMRRTRHAWPLTLGLLACLVHAAIWCLWPGQPGQHDLQQAFSRTVLFVSGGLLALLSTTTYQRMMVAACSILIAGVVQVIIGVALMSAPERVSMLGMPVAQSGRALGTFVNPDHFANYLLLCFGAGTGLMMSVHRPRIGPFTLRQRVVAAIEFVMSPRMLIRLALVALVIGLVLSRSRMGNGAFVVALIMMGMACWRGWPSHRSSAAILLGSIVVVDMLVVGQWVGLDKVVNRIERTALSAERQHMLDTGTHGITEETLEERLRTGRDAWQMAMASPWTGHGPGRFGSVFPAYKAPDGLPLWVDHAHNDYAQFAAERGLPMLALGLAMGLATVWRLWRLLGEGQARHSKGMATGLLMSLTAMAIHCVVDFNLQVAANAMTLTVLLGLAWALPDTSKP